jgi:type VI protein secretion system component VasF
MTLLELCEPLLLKVCELNRMARLGLSQDYAEVVAEIGQAIGQIDREIQATPALARAAGPLVTLQEDKDSPREDSAKDSRRVRQIVLVLTYFVDSMIASSKLKFAADWNQHRYATEKYGELSGDDRFFDFLTATLNDASEEAAERLTVFYVCLGLGFVGGLAGQTAQLEGYMKQILPRIRHLLDTDLAARLCPSAYHSVDTRDLVEPPARPLVLVGILFVFLCVSTLVVYVGMYVRATCQLSDAIQTILKP